MVTLTFDLLTLKLVRFIVHGIGNHPIDSKTMSLLGYPKIIRIPSLNTLGSFIFSVNALDKQTNRQTEGLEHSIHAVDIITHADYVSRRE